jgi:hypothetical protein
VLVEGVTTLTTGDVVIGADDDVVVPATGPAAGAGRDRPVATATASLSATARAADSASDGSAGSPGCGSTAGSEATGARKICSWACCGEGCGPTSGTGTGST